MPRIFILSILGLLVFAMTVLIFMPAVYVTSYLEEKSGGRYALADVRGSVWAGSAVLIANGDKQNSSLPLVPGRFTWQLSPMLLLGKIFIEIENADALTTTLKIQGDSHQWQIAPSGIRLHADQLSLLGAPFNTLKLNGDVLISWQELLVSLQDSPQGQQINTMGMMYLDLKKITSALSPIKPLGSYQLKIIFEGSYANLELSTLLGPLQLSGQGILHQGRLTFSGVAYADPGQEKQLSLLLNLLGRPKGDSHGTTVALEFK